MTAVLTSSQTPPPPSDSPAAASPAGLVPATRRPRRADLGLAFALTGAAVLLVAALWPQLLATHDPRALDLAAPLQAPSLDHWFGTDQNGRDLYSRIVHGTGPSLLIGLGAAAVGVGLGMLLGIVAAFGGRWADAAVSRTVEVLFAFPSLLLALMLITVYGPSVSTLILAVGVGTAPGYARLVRGQVLAVRGSAYVQAAEVIGHPPMTILLQHIVPNAVRPLVAVFMLGVGQAIVWASGLAFLGFGVAPPSPEWGALLEAGRPYITAAWWLEIFPGLAVLATALTATALGRHLEARLQGETR